jgi:transcription initiation factor IIE alpha subunit
MMGTAMPIDPIEHWLQCMLGQIQAPKLRGHRRYIDGTYVPADEASRKVVHEIVKERGEICAQDILKLSGFQKTTIYRALEQLVQADILDTVKSKTPTKNGRYLKNYIIKKRASL